MQNLTKAADLPTLTHTIAGTPLTLKSEPADFRVTEIPAYPPSGTGSHCFIRLEKVSMTTHDAISAIAKKLAVPSRDVGYAGLKDKHAITEQWISIEGIAPPPPGPISPGLQILESQLHEQKLRIGHLRGNRFVIRARGVAATALPRVDEVVKRLSLEGVPNYFGPQRFGRGNLSAAQRWLLEGQAPPRSKRMKKFFVSVLQSHFFNHCIAQRFLEERFTQVQDGDVLKKEDTGGLFTVQTSELEEAQRRVDAFECSITGPMFGSKMRWAERDALNSELTLLSEGGWTQEALLALGKLGRGTRRPLRVPLIDPSIREVEDGFELSFSLRKGSFATVVMREISKE